MGEWVSIWSNGQQRNKVHNPKIESIFLLSSFSQPNVQIKNIPQHPPILPHHLKNGAKNKEYMLRDITCDRHDQKCSIKNMQ